MTNFEKVGLFMKTFGQEVKVKAGFSSDKINKLRVDLINEELEELRQAIQAISQSTHPLSKCMDFVHDDVALMNEEAEEWNKMYRDKIGLMEAASKDTDEALQALVERREEIRDQIAAEKLKINSVKASIAMNDARIAELLQMVVHTSR